MLFFMPFLPLWFKKNFVIFLYALYAFMVQKTTFMFFFVPFMPLWFKKNFISLMVQKYYRDKTSFVVNLSAPAVT